MKLRHTYIRLLIAALLFAAGQTGAVFAQGRAESEVKALFFVTLARYTEWPTNAFANDKSPIIVGVLGPDPFGNLLESLTAKEEIRARNIRVQRFASADEIENCHVLFFGQMSALRLEVELSKLKGRPILTVSDRPAFAQSGGMVELYVNEEKKVRLRVSKSSLNRSKLELSPSLMRLAQIVAIIEWVPESFNPGITLEPAVSPKNFISLSPTGSRSFAKSVP